MENAINRFKNGGMLIVMDDENRENEGDLIVAAEYCTPEIMTFIINNTTGIVCVTMTNSMAKKLELQPMVINNTDNHQTAFTVTCDSVESGTGVSSIDRCKTIKSLLSGNPNNLRRPGHIFPLIAKDRLLSTRLGHTEASITLCELAELRKMAVISELKNDDGTMKNRDDCIIFSEQHNIPIITIKDIIEYRKNWLSDCDFVNKFGEWELRTYNNSSDKNNNSDKNSNKNSNKNRPHVVLIKGEINSEDIILVRIHSECFTGDVLGSYLCDCGSQLENSMKYIQDEGKGIIIYVNGHEGRGIGLTDKIKAYSLQQKEKLSTYEANIKLGHSEDSRDYSDIVDILKSLKINNIHLLTNNPKKIEALNSFNVTYKPIDGYRNVHNDRYLNDKEKYFLSNNNNNNIKGNNNNNNEEY